MDERVYTEIERLSSLRIQELRARYRELFGEDSRTAHKQHLVRQIAWRLQVQAQGDLSERARQRALEIANDADLKTQVPPHWEGPGPTAQNPPQGPQAGRIPAAGTLLRRVYRDRTVVVKIDPDRGFRVRGPALWIAQRGGAGRHRRPLERPIVLRPDPTRQGETPWRPLNPACPAWCVAPSIPASPPRRA